MNYSVKTPLMTQNILDFVSQAFKTDFKTNYFLTESVNKLFEALRQGHSCCYLDEDEKHQLLAYPFVLTVKKPEVVIDEVAILKHNFHSFHTKNILIVFDNYLSFSSYFVKEVYIYLKLKSLSEQNIFKKFQDKQEHLSLVAKMGWQQADFKQFIESNLLLINGGPGTGKTTLVAKILESYLELNSRIKIILAAPTGKAAFRLQESIEREAKKFDFKQLLSLLAENKLEVKTLSRVLGMGHNRLHPTYNFERQLSADIILIDESSMVDLDNFFHIISALKEDAKLILVGDENQLNPIMIGDIFNKLIKIFGSYNLTQSYRQKQNLYELAAQVLAQKPNILESAAKESAAIEHYKLDKKFQQQLLDKFFKHYDTCINAVEIEDALKNLQQLQILTLTRKGNFSITTLNSFINKKLLEKYPDSERFYLKNELVASKTPIIINKNDYELGLFNGDMGLVLNAGHLVQAVFLVGNNLRFFSIDTLPDFDLAWCISVHKSQGSEYDNVILVLPEIKEASLASNLLEQRLIYTAITRAKNSLVIACDESVWEEAVGNKLKRFSMLESILNFLK